VKPGWNTELGEVAVTTMFDPCVMTFYFLFLGMLGIFSEWRLGYNAVDHGFGHDVAHFVLLSHVYVIDFGYEEAVHRD